MNPQTKIRLATRADGHSLAEIYRPSVVEGATSFEVDPPGGEEMAGRVERLLVATPWLVCQRGDAVLGYAYAGPHRERAAYQWSVEVSAYVGAAFQRRGVAKALYSALFAALVVQGFRNAYAGITLPNPASVGLHVSMGFEPVGVYHGVGHKHGQWHDVAWFERALAPREARVEMPRPLSVCLDDPRLAIALQVAEEPSRP